MEWQVTLARTALRDLENIHDFIARENLDAALKISVELLDRMASLAASPHLGVEVSVRPGVRKLVHWPRYAIYYRVGNSNRVIEVVRVWDCRRDPARLKLQKRY